MKKPKDTECPENSTPILRIKVKTVIVPGKGLKIIREENDQPCDPAKVRRLIKGERVKIETAAKPSEAGQGENPAETESDDPELDEILESLEGECARPENEPVTPELDEILKDYVEKMP